MIYLEGAMSSRLPITVSAAVAIAVLLAGCVSPEQRQQQRVLEEQRRESDRQALLAQARAQCEEFGFQPGTDGLATCVQQGIQRAQLETERRKQVEDCKNAMLMRATSDSSLADTAANVKRCNSNPHADSDERPQKPPSYSCKEDIHGNVNCNPR